MFRPSSVSSPWSLLEKRTRHARPLVFIPELQIDSFTVDVRPNKALTPEVWLLLPAEMWVPLIHKTPCSDKSWILLTSVKSRDRLHLNSFHYCGSPASAVPRMIIIKASQVVRTLLHPCRDIRDVGLILGVGKSLGDHDHPLLVFSLTSRIPWAEEPGGL